MVTGKPPCFHITYFKTSFMLLRVLGDYHFPQCSMWHTEKLKIGFTALLILGI